MIVLRAVPKLTIVEFPSETILNRGLCPHNNCQLYIVHCQLQRGKLRCETIIYHANAEGWENWKNAEEGAEAPS